MRSSMGQHRVYGRGTRGPSCGGIAAALALAVFGGLSARAQQIADNRELIARESQPTFKLEVQRNLVVVRAIVRDAKGRPVANLRKEDFRVFDNGKPQVISHFAVETAASKSGSGAGPAPRKVDEEALPETALAPSTPHRYLAIYFDDVHMDFGEIVRSRDAADHYLAGALEPGDRVGIFSSSGQTVLDFTDDRAKLHESIFHLQQRPVTPREDNPCPDISDYQAYQMVHEHDPFAIEIAVNETLQCRYNGDSRYLPQAESDAASESVRVLSYFETESEHALRGLEQLVRRISILPGQRNVVLVSPGFLTVTQLYRINEIVDRALRSSVVVNTLDARGLYVNLPFGDASKKVSALPDRADLVGKKAQILLSRASRASDGLRDLAYDTGGEFFHNSNDFDEGFRKVGALPEVYYILAFSPQNLKLDGRFHTLKVSLEFSKGLTVQARRGYFAPRKSEDAAVQAKEEIEQAVFSHDEVKELPIDVHTQFFKVNDRDARLSVLTHVDMHFLRFLKGEGRNLNKLTVVTALFDRDGKYVTGREKLIEFRLLDTSLEKLMESGITSKTSFEIRPGTYMVRQVVRDGQGGQLSALNRTVEIPY